MSATITRTFTATYARIDLLETQVRVALRRTTRLTEGQLELLCSVGIHEKLIGCVRVVGLGTDGLARVMLEMVIDWSRHAVHVRAGRVQVGVDDGRWPGGASIELDECVRIFTTYLERHGLTTKDFFYPAPGVDLQAFLTRLNLVLVDPPTWAGTPEGRAFTVPEIDEFRVGVYIGG